MIARRCWVSGRVQGVFYRKTAAERARALALRGHARNLPDGRVEVLVLGPEGPVQEFIEFLWIGPSAARVTAVDVETAEPHATEWPAGFITG
jgi:acylphosphatase